MAAEPRQCADCLHFKTRVFRSERELRDFLDYKLKDALRGGCKTARSAVQRFGEVRIYWCALRGRGPYLKANTIMKCNDFMPDEVEYETRQEASAA